MKTKTKDIKYLLELSENATSEGDTISQFVNRYGLTEFWKRYKHYQESSKSAEDFIHGLCEMLSD